MKNSSQWKYNLFLWNASIFHSVDSEWMLCKYSTHEETLCYSKSNTDLVSEYYLQSPDLNSSILQSEWWPWGRKHTPTITWSSKGQKNSSFLLLGYFQGSLRQLEMSLIPLIPSEPMAEKLRGSLRALPGFPAGCHTHPWVCLSGQPSAPVVCLRQDWWSTGGHLRPQRRIRKTRLSGDHFFKHDLILQIRSVSLN